MLKLFAKRLWRNGFNPGGIRPHRDAQPQRFLSSLPQETDDLRRIAFTLGNGTDCVNKLGAFLFGLTCQINQDDINRRSFVQFNGIIQFATVFLITDARLLKGQFVTLALLRSGSKIMMLLVLSKSSRMP